VVPAFLLLTVPGNSIVHAVLDFQQVGGRNPALPPPCYKAHIQATDSCSEREYHPSYHSSTAGRERPRYIEGATFFSKIGEGCLYTATRKETKILLLLAYIACLYLCNRSGDKSINLRGRTQEKRAAESLKGNIFHFPRL